MHIVRALSLPLALLAAWPLAAQQPQARGAPDAREQRATDDDEIVVHGIRLRDPEDLPVRVARPLAMGRVTRGMAADAAMFARCAGLPRLPQMHRILDGHPDTGETQKALHRHLVRNVGCLQDVPLSPFPASPYFGVCNSELVNASVLGEYSLRTWLSGKVRFEQAVCRTDFDRGFIYEGALREYAPDLTLSRSNTFDHATRDRFRAREEERNRARSDGAAEFFFAAACMVQIRPKYALALLREEPGSEAEARLRAMLISDGAACVGGATQVQVDARQFRAFLAEAVYSWAGAVKRTDSLLPSEASG